MASAQLGRCSRRQPRGGRSERGILRVRLPRLSGGPLGGTKVRCTRNHAMDEDLRVPTVSQYVAAFRAIGPRITPNQRKMLLFHHRAPGRVVSASLLAEEADFEGYGGANLQYGLLGSELLKQLRMELPEGAAKCGILVEFVDPKFAANQEWLWVLRGNLAQAIEELGWVRKTSHLLYPGDAFEEV